MFKISDMCLNRIRATIANLNIELIAQAQFAKGGGCSGCDGCAGCEGCASYIAS